MCQTFLIEPQSVEGTVWNCKHLNRTSSNMPVEYVNTTRKGEIDCTQSTNLERKRSQTVVKALEKRKKRKEELAPDILGD